LVNVKHLYITQIFNKIDDKIINGMCIYKNKECFFKINNDDIFNQFYEVYEISKIIYKFKEDIFNKR
jgi:hypothetical protein